MPDQQPFKSVAILTRPHLLSIQAALAAKIKQQHGGEVHIITPRPEDVKDFGKGFDRSLCASVTGATSVLMDQYPTGFNQEELIAEARQWEQRIGMTINMLFLQNRHHGRGYALGGFHHPRSRHSETPSYDQVLKVYVDTLNWWRDYFEEHGITMLMGGNPEGDIVAESMGIPVRALVESRYKNYWLWTEGRFNEMPLIESVQAHAAPVPQDQIPDAPPKFHQFNRAAALKRSRFSQTVLGIARQIRKHLIWRLTGYYKARDYYLSSEIGYLLRIWRQTGQLLAPKAPTMEALAGRRFVFYPLHVEPERALQGNSPEYMYQLAAIVSIARDLPAGIFLVVKEHVTAIGRRPDRFYDQISELKNVVLVDALIPGLEMVKASDAVVTITGTAGLEAAMMGRPVISFGRHNWYNFLPHVWIAEREEDIAGILAEALTDDPNQHAKWVEAGAKLVTAIKEVSFDLEQFDYRHAESLEDWMVEAIFDSLNEEFYPPASTSAGKSTVLGQ
jgi:hypothetical protein